MLRIAINSAIGLGLVFIWSRFVNLGEIVKILKTVDVKLALLFFLFFVISTLLRGWRLKLLLSGYKLPFKDAVTLNLVSQFLSFTIPIRAGELVKSVYLTSQFDLPLGKTIIWVFIDRFLDFWAVLFLITLLLGLVPTVMSGNLIKAVFILLAGFTLASIIVVSSQNFAKRATVFLSHFLVFDKLKSWFVNFTHTAIDGFEVLRRHPLELLSLVGLTLAALISDSLIWLVMFRSLGVDVGIFKSVMGNCLTALTFLVPAAPGYVGSAEAAGLAVFGGVLGFEANIVSAAAVLFHILTLITLPIFGISSLYILKFDLNLVWKKLRGG